jgi:hypothetical protein
VFSLGFVLFGACKDSPNNKYYLDKFLGKFP